MRISSTSISAMIVAAAAAMIATAPVVKAWEYSYFCYIFPRLTMLRTSGAGSPTVDHMTWAFAQSMHAYNDLYRNIDDIQFRIDRAYLMWQGQAQSFYSVRGVRNLGDGGGNQTRDFDDFENEMKTEFDPNQFDMDKLYSFKRFPGDGLDVSDLDGPDEDLDMDVDADTDGKTDKKGKKGKADKKGKNGKNRNLRGFTNSTTPDYDGGRALADTDGADHSAQFTSRIRCEGCTEWKNYFHSTRTNGGNTREFLHKRWEGGWCERITQKARRNSDYRSLAGARDCYIYLAGCRDGVYGNIPRSLEGVEGAEGAQAVPVPAELVESYKASIANDPKRAAVADALDAKVNAMAGAN